MAKTQDAAEGATAAPSPYIWVASNRKDDRVVLFELDPAHPGGEAFVGGDSVARVARTPQVNGLLREGLLVEIPEPPDGPKKPLPIADDPSLRPADGPGQPIRLGRELDPDLVPTAGEGKVAAQQDAAPDQIPSTATLPPPPPAGK